MQELVFICVSTAGVILSGLPDQRSMLGGQPFRTKATYPTMYKVVDDSALSMVWLGSCCTMTGSTHIEIFIGNDPPIRQVPHVSIEY